MTRLSLDQASELIGQAAAAHTGPLSLSEASHKAAANMQREYRELIATLTNDWAKKCFAWLRVHGPSGDEAITDGNVWVLEQWMKTSLLASIDAGMRPEIITSESVADLARLRKEVAYFGLFPQEQAAEEIEAVSAGPSEDDIDAQVIADWRNLPTSEIRSKCRDTAYKSRFDRLMNEGRLGR